MDAALNLNKKVFIDHRWSGNHGLGRLTNEIIARNNYNILPCSGSPSSPIDPFKLCIHQFKIPKNGIFLTFGYSVPFYPQRRYIITLADLNFIDTPINSNWLKRSYFNIHVRKAIKRSESVFTISDFSKKRISEWSGVDTSKIINIGCGVSSEFQIDGGSWLPGFKYIYLAGNRKPHKNEVRGIEAFSRANISKNIKLVLTGHSIPNLKKTINSLKLNERVVFLGSISNSELANLYRGAMCLLFPSLYEGFGLPVVEAMACGIPVITSNSTSLPEIAGDAAVLVDPMCVDNIKTAIENIVYNRIDRKSLVQKGLLRTKEFDWGKVVKRINETLALNEFKM